MHIQICPTVAEARAYLQAQLSAAQSAAGRQLPAHLPTLTVDLDTPGITEQECAEQLYTLAPLRMLYIASRSSQPVPSGEEPTTSTPVIVTSPEQTLLRLTPNMPEAASDWPIAGAAVKQQWHYPCLRRCITKPVKMSIWLRQTLELLQEPEESESSGPLSPRLRGGSSSWSRSRSSSMSSVASASDSGQADFHTGSLLVAPTSRMDLRTPPSSSSASSQAGPSKIHNVALQYPLRSIDKCAALSWPPRQEERNLACRALVFLTRLRGCFESDAFCFAFHQNSSGRGSRTPPQ
jgi:hypothetical protein